MTIDWLVEKYLPMPRKTCYLLLSVLEPCPVYEICQTASELSNGEFDDEENLRESLEDQVRILEHDKLIQRVFIEGEEYMELTELGTKLLICELTRVQETEKEILSV